MATLAHALAPPITISQKLISNVRIELHKGFRVLKIYFAICLPLVKYIVKILDFIVPHITIILLCFITEIVHVSSMSKLQLITRLQY